MGSWNETCAFSNLPIQVGDEVVWLLLTPNPYQDGINCYLNSFFSPRSVPLYGTYADYGRVKPDEGEEPILALIEYQFQQDLISTPAVNFDNYSFALLQDWLHEGAVFIDHQHLTRQATLAHNHRVEEEIAQMREYLSQDSCPAHENWETFKTEELAAIEANRDRYYVYPPEATPITPARVVRVMVLRAVWDIFTQIEHRVGISLQRYRKGVDSHIAALLENVALESTAHSLWADSSDRDNLFLERFGMALIGVDIPFGMSTIEARQHLISKFSQGNITLEVLRSVYYRMCELAMVEATLSSARMYWHPSTGTGSQSAEYALLAELHFKMADLAFDACTGNAIDLPSRS